MKNDYQLTLEKADKLSQKGEISKAKIIYEQLISDNPQNYEAIHNLAWLHIREKEHRPAINWLNRAIGIKPSDPQLITHLANIYKETGDLKQSEHYYRRAIELNPNYAQAHNNLGNLYYHQKNWGKALKYFAKAVNLKYDYDDAHYNLGLLFLKRSQYDHAKTQFNNVVQLNPLNWQAHYYLATIYLHEQAFERADQTLQQVIKLNSNFPDAFNNLGVVQLKKKNPQQAIDYFTRALAINNHHLEARHNIAATFMEFDRFENAITHYRELLRLQPNDINAHYNLGVALMILGLLSEATHHYQQVLVQNPEHTDTLINLGTIHLKFKRNQAAITCFKTVLSAQPHHQLANYLLTATTGKTPESPPPHAYIRNLFNNYALYYDDHMEKKLKFTVPALLCQAIKKIAPNFHAKQTLDLGCGSGLAGAAIKQFTEQLNGIDLSRKMLAIASSKKIYNQLIEADLTEALQADTNYYQLIIASDVFPYLGDLEEILSLCRARLTREGLLAFSVENLKGDAYKLQTTLRYTHAPQYIHRMVAKIGFSILLENAVIGRYQENQPLTMRVFILRQV